MDFQSLVHELFPGWRALILIGSKIVLLAIFFEFAAWWAGRKLEKIAAPFIALDQGRDPKWRATRRATLRHTPKIISRTLIYTVALILVFETFGVQVLSLSLAIAAVCLLLGAALIPMFRDYSQGYILLSEDTLAPGDEVEINGRRGTVEKWTLRGTWIRDAAGQLHVLSNRNVRDVTIIRRAADETPRASSGSTNGVAFDPLAEAAAKKR